MNLKIAISPCPNDIFAFFGLLSGAVQSDPFHFDFTFLDIQQLNNRLLNDLFDCQKASFSAALRLDQHMFIDAGAALGVGVGPIVVSAQPSFQLSENSKIVGPGPDTTATLLFKSFFPTAEEISHKTFTEIMPALKSGEFDAGIVIHEGRFTYKEYGLHICSDLGQIWEERYRAPLPLGGLFVKKDFPQTQELEKVIQKSILYGFENWEKTLPMMREYATELDDTSLLKHVDLYVNRFTISLGQEGRSAIATLKNLIDA